MNAPSFLRRPSVFQNLVVASLPALLGTLPSCAARGGLSQPGASSPLDAPSEEPTPEPAARDAGSHPVSPSGATGASAEAPRPALPDADQVHADHELQIADELLKAAPTPADQFGLVLVLGQRAADLYWTFAIENRGSAPVRLDSDLMLLELTLTPKAAADGAAPVAPYACNPLTKTPSANRSELLPGETEVFSFDPRSICPVELLNEGTTVSGTYGYLIEKQSKWERGKKVELLLEDKAPFVATVAPPPDGQVGEVTRPKKQLFTPAMVLDQTYPLDAVSLFAEADPWADLGGNAPPPPVSVSIRDIAEARTPTYQIVNVTLKNISPEPLDVVVRRELLTFEVVGPKGATTCRMEPTQVDPLAHNFAHLDPGASRALATRLPEICPAGTFAAPGQYSVFVRYRSPSKGTEFGKQGFEGEVRSSAPAHLRVPDPLRNRGPALRFRRSAPQSPDSTSHSNAKTPAGATN